ncbi:MULTISPECIES: formate-dependent phosphoribosylglycinamide formyltransferase [unclassified Imperialibacter]|uniref:formate-dependent phosphoribosylglycinamide formyltransferase n=1 Tax=unclassified Imperialibacter TaxID=2629706 RepID=UPI0012584F4C|nr:MULTISPECIES: formate-dependent phosphoribosylglycinamide formyltransferase [unclassified Imperialibacter]CAD5253625.1 phosphoribosylglycinamide formyltransferase 2 [Imperialibacter sp. 89]CAD5275538.1 phosphoribosylglycinamide formyltransferase 2 [Imperialibacter sp. 75]VVT19825.1 phosphoribosylglycinamide formyltransferase 2 [Imperialibacter sp. EC-SDR9]
MKKILLLGSGELGKEFVISAKRLGCYVVACDSYVGAPAMQVADEYEVFNMLSATELRTAVERHQPDLIVPEIEAIRTEVLVEMEKEGKNVVPSARAVNMTMNRDRIRDLAADLGVRTARFAYAESADQLVKEAQAIGFPVVIKPVMSSSGKGQSVAQTADDIQNSWDYACAGMRGDRQRVIVEEFIRFDYEITLLTVRQKNGPTLFCDPIGHVQERGDYQYSWQPQPMIEKFRQDAEAMAKAVTDDLGGVGIFGVEFFVTKDEVIFSELSPRPHDTGMVTLISQNLSEFDLHARAILGLPIPNITVTEGASAVVLATKDGVSPTYTGVETAMSEPDIDVRIFGKPTTRPCRRMAVVLAKGENAVERARAAAAKIKVVTKGI